MGFEPLTATNFDLWDRICQSSEFYQGIDAQVPALRRGKLFDAMLSREGRPAVFAGLSDDLLVQVGNAATRFLRTQVGDDLTNALMYGKQTLEKLGIGEGLSRLLGDAMGAPVQIEMQQQSIIVLPSENGYR